MNLRRLSAGDMSDILGDHLRRTMLAGGLPTNYVTVHVHACHYEGFKDDGFWYITAASAIFGDPQQPTASTITTTRYKLVLNGEGTINCLTVGDHDMYETIEAAVEAIHKEGQ